MYTPLPYGENYLPRENGHKIYYAEFGNPSGVSIINCHGGPGGSSKPKHASAYNLKKYRVVNFDQRGCGRSYPSGKIEGNKIIDLVLDMERLRNQLNITEWFVAGSSWGSTLAIVYALNYPERVKGLLLSALFLGDSKTDKWAFRDNKGAAQLFPDVWQQLTDNLQEIAINVDDENVSRQLLEKISSNDVSVRQKVSSIVASWEVNLLSRNIALQYKRSDEVTDCDIDSVKVFLNYQANNYWLEDGYIIHNVEKIRDIPTIIVHGRYDILCPLSSAWELKQLLANAELVVLPESHHLIAGDGEVARYYAYENFLKTNTV